MGQKGRVSGGKKKKEPEYTQGDKREDKRDKRHTTDKQNGNGKEGSTKGRGGEKKSAVICPRE